MKEKNLYDKLREALNNKLIPEIIEYKKELSENEICINISKCFVMKIDSDNYVSFSDSTDERIQCNFMQTDPLTGNRFINRPISILLLSKIHYSKFNLFNIDKYTKPNLIEICTAVAKKIKSLQEERRIILNLINTPLLYKNKLLIEKTQK